MAATLLAAGASLAMVSGLRMTSGDMCFNVPVLSLARHHPRLPGWFAVSRSSSLFRLILLCRSDQHSNTLVRVSVWPGNVGLVDPLHPHLMCHAIARSGLKIGEGMLSKA